MQVTNLISIHAPTRGATGEHISGSMVSADFNPRSHEGSDWVPAFCASITSRFQSTLPRGERRIPEGIADKLSPISIHAPTRGATVLKSKYAEGTLISIHAPTRGATPVRLSHSLPS